MAHSRTFKAGILSFGQASTKLIGLVSVMILARLFTKEDYATYRQALLVYNFAAPVLLLGLPQAIYYFMPNHPERKRDVLASNMAALSFMGLLFTGFLLFGGAAFLAEQFNNPALETPLRYIAWYPLFLFPAAGISACLMVNDRVKELTVYNIASRFVMLVTVIVPALVWQTPAAAILGFVCAGAIILAPGLWLMLTSTDTGTLKPSFQDIWSQLKFAVPLGLAGMLGQVMLGLDKILISKFFNPEIFAVYVNGAMEIPLISLVTGSATAVLLPEMTKMMGAGTPVEALNLWKRAAVKCSLIIFPVFVFLMLMAPEVMVLLYGADYAQSAEPLRIYLLLLPIRIGFFGTIFMAIGRSDIILWRTLVGLVLNVVLSLIMIHAIGYLGAVVATVIVVFAWDFGFNVWYLKKRLFPGQALFNHAELRAIAAQAVFCSVLLIPFKLLPLPAEVEAVCAGALFTGLILLVYVRTGTLSKDAILRQWKQRVQPGRPAQD